MLRTAHRRLESMSDNPKPPRLPAHLAHLARAPERQPVPPQPDPPPRRGQPGRLVIVPDQLPSTGPGPQPAAPPRRADSAEAADLTAAYLIGGLGGAVAMGVAVFLLQLGGRL